MTKNLKRLSWYRREVRDPYQPQYYTAITCSVYAPTMERPYASVLISIANAGGRVLLRVTDIEAAQRVIWLPLEAIGRLTAAVIKANEQADQVEQDMRVIFERRRLPAGAGLARTDTGEIVAEAERILTDTK